MSTVGSTPATPSRSAPYTPAQSRIIDAALRLFTRHGVGGTSLQMIADELGVTKAAVYHKFRAKQDIVLAVAEVELARLEKVVDAAEAEECSLQARELLLTRVIDLAVERRHVLNTMQADPIMVRFLAEHEPFQRLTKRLFFVLMGKDATLEKRVPAAMISGAIGGAAAHPLAMRLDDDTLRYHLTHLAHRLLQFPE
nr:helix-turn-helix domain-containing protein [Streptomyces fuscichromogenes]